MLMGSRMALLGALMVAAASCGDDTARGDQTVTTEQTVSTLPGDDSISTLDSSVPAKCVGPFEEAFPGGQVLATLPHQGPPNELHGYFEEGAVMDTCVGISALGARVMYVVTESGQGRSFQVDEDGVAIETTV